MEKQPHPNGSSPPKRIIFQCFESFETIDFVKITIKISPVCLFWLSLMRRGSPGAAVLRFERRKSHPTTRPRLPSRPRGMEERRAWPVRRWLARSSIRPILSRGCSATDVASSQQVPCFHVFPRVRAAEASCMACLAAREQQLCSHVRAPRPSLQLFYGRARHGRRLRVSSRDMHRRHEMLTRLLHGQGGSAFRFEHLSPTSAYRLEALRELRTMCWHAFVCVARFVRALRASRTFCACDLGDLRPARARSVSAMFVSVSTSACGSDVCGPL